MLHFFHMKHIEKKSLALLIKGENSYYILLRTFKRNSEHIFILLFKKAHR